MEEVENKAVEQEIVQEIATPQTEADQEVQVETQATEDRNSRNWRELRRAKDDLERKAKMQDELIQQLVSAQAKPQVQVPEEEDILSQIAREEYVPGEKVAKGLKKIEERFDRKVREIESKYAEKQQASLMQEVKREYADFDQVVNPETLDLLEETNPRLAASLAKTMKDDPYAFAVQSYEYIKSRGLSKGSTQSKRANETEKKIEQNKKTIPSPQAFDKRPMAQAFKVTDDMKKELAREMYEYAQQAGGY